MRLLSAIFAKPTVTGGTPSGPGEVRRAESAGRVPTLPKALDALGRAEALDRVTTPLQKAVRGLPLGRFRDVLHGRPIGHPLHPALVQVPMGAWLSAAVLDLVPGAGRNARLLVGVGVVSVAPAAWAGWVDWAEQPKEQLRTGLVHAASNAAAIGLYAGSWKVRGRGRPVLGRALAFAGLTAAGLGGVIGGHIAFRQSAGSNKTAALTHLVEPGWHSLGSAEALPVGKAVQRMLGTVPLFVLRTADGDVHVLADGCSHFSGRLSEGEVTDGCVECPLHSSVFRLSDGMIVRGPATAPQPVFETEVTENGVLRVRLPAAG
ncbi:Rieske 2Fe-2S domain-containing protein [Streptomyces violascens]|uniref:Rieske 2Fe-2S domain-containing protein n=1 Tax=Streptomyces violascens TaxID=67381 RepID=UPI0036AE9B4F